MGDILLSRENTSDDVVALKRAAPSTDFKNDDDSSHDEETADEEDKIEHKARNILKRGELYKKEGKAEELADLIKSIRPFLNSVSKAKAAMLVRSLVDYFLDLNVGIDTQVQLCQECVAWAKEERRNILRQHLEVRLVSLYFRKGQLPEALDLSTQLEKELKKVDDTRLLVEVLLMESKTYYALKNMSQARSSFTSARIAANSIDSPGQIMGDLDLQAGILYAADEKDFKTAYSYWFEAFQQYDSVGSPLASTALRYLLLSKIMLHEPEDVPHILSGKLCVKYAGKYTEPIVALAQACKKRSLVDFQSTLSTYNKELQEDRILRAHLADLYEHMLEQNLHRIIEPYSKVEISYLAKVVGLSIDAVEQKLSQMIIDKLLHGILDESEGLLIVFQDRPTCSITENTLEIIQEMGKVVDSLYLKAKRLT